MSGDPFDSGLELIVLEGGGSGLQHYLSRTRITLGRHDPSDQPSPHVITFPEPTVSRVHALLEWSHRDNAYLISHRSRTNPTLVNESLLEDPVLLNLGDTIRMGHLVLQLAVGDSASRPTPNISEPLQTGLHLLVLSGAEKGDIHPLNYDRFEVGHPSQSPIFKIPLAEADSAAAGLNHLHGAFWANALEGANFLLKASPGLIRVQKLLPDPPLRLSPDNLLLVGSVALAQVSSERVGGMASALKAGRECHPLQSGLRLDQEVLWDLGEEHVFQVTGGPMEGSSLHVDPVTLARPIVIARARSHPDACFELHDGSAGQVEIAFTEGQVRLTPLDSRVGHNWDEVAQGQTANLTSGDTLTMGRTVITYRNRTIDRTRERYALDYQGEKLSLSRAINQVGYGSHCEIKIPDRRLGPTHGVFEVREDGLYYRHRHLAFGASHGSNQVARGQEVRLEVGDKLGLAPGIEVEVVSDQ